MRRALLALVVLVTSPVGAAWSQSLDLTAEIARLRARLAANSAQEQHCLASATQPVLTASLATDLKALQARANQAAAEGASVEAQRWRELARKAAALEARTTANARTGAELFQSQQIGLDCLDRFAAERGALRASLEVAVVDPGAYGESLGETRAHGTARLRQDLVRLQERSRALSAQWRLTQADAAAGAQALKAEMADLRRRNTAALESDAARVMADPTLRAAEALVATAEAWDRERTASVRLSASRDDTERRKTVLERSDAARQAREYWASAERLLGRRVSEAAPIPTRGTASPEAGGTP
ncbi:MAG TPA: hypothetical protein VIE41_17295 [Methylomirabilota bacterium]|jgi:hypothetical protein